MNSFRFLLLFLILFLRVNLVQAIDQEDCSYDFSALVSKGQIGKAIARNSKNVSVGDIPVSGLK